MTLTPRSPWNDMGYVEISNPLSWNPDTNTVEMQPSVEFRGPVTKGHIEFRPPSTGQYVVSLEGRGNGIEMSLSDASGKSEGAAHWRDEKLQIIGLYFTANAGETMKFKFSSNNSTRDNQNPKASMAAIRVNKVVS